KNFMDASTETKSKKKSSDRKLEILRTLVRMMTESENKHITTKSLAAAIGVSEAALYRHFPSKTKMYEEIIGFAENYVMTAVNSISSSEYSGLEQAKKLFLALIDIKTKEPGLVFLFCGDSLTSEDPRLQGELNRFYGQLQAVFKQSLRLAVAQEEVPEGYDVLTRANMLVALILGHWLRFAKGDASGGAVDPEKQVYLVLGK
uniref:nucleoid occlusion factor SlmA n=1 Tax=Parasutterella excrementihominis TaxID=487175 RepID=UPI003FEDF9A6